MSATDQRTQQQKKRRSGIFKGERIGEWLLTHPFASAMANTLPDVSSTRSYFTESAPEDKTAPAVTNVRIVVPKNSLKVSQDREESESQDTSSGNAGVNLFEAPIR